MIRVSDNIGNPIEFVRSNRQYLQNASQDGFVVLAADDYDVSVGVYKREPATKVAAVIDCEIFGKAASFAVARGVNMDADYADISWSNSSKRVSEIQEELGLEPVVDCPRFTNSEFDMIPTAEYVSYFAGGMYPRSCGSDAYYFYHDREQHGHNLGAMLLPKIYVENFALYAIKCLIEADQKKMNDARKSFDHATASATECVRAATGYLSAEQAEKAWNYARHLGGLDLVKELEGTMKHEFRKRVLEVLPKIEKIKKGSIDQRQYIQGIFN